MYRLHWETTTGPEAKDFPTWDDAKAYAVAEVSPEVNSAVVPTITLDTDAMGDAYSSGVFWLGNRFAAIESI